MRRAAIVSMVVGLLFAAAAAAEPARVGYPSSIIALGDSGSTGYNSGRPGVDTKENSWSTGDNPAVQSHYLRILAANPTHFDAKGEPDSQRVAFVDQKVAMYEAQLVSGCAVFIHCRYAADNTHVELEDLSSDWGHPSVHGLAKRAASTWAAGFDFTDTSPPASKASRSGRKVTLTATDNAGVSGIEYRLSAKSAWLRYTKAATIPKGKTLTWRAVDVNGNCEATHSLKG